MSKKSENINSTFSSSTPHSLLVKPITIEEKPTVTKFKSSFSENNIKVSSKGIKQKIVNRVKSWSSRDKYQMNDTLEIDVGETTKNPDRETDQTEEISNSNLTRARGSLESLFRDEQTVPNDGLRSRSCSSASGSRKHCPDSPKSSPLLSENSKEGTRCLFWDPFDKKGRKNRKDYKRKKENKNNQSTHTEHSSSIPLEGKSCLSKKDTNTKEDVTDETLEDENYYKYRYFPKNSKSVVFTNEVFVVYFNGEDIVYESKEPLKKDIEQQMRNREMRQGHLLKTHEKYNLCLF